MHARRDDSGPGPWTNLVLFGWLSAALGVVSAPLALGVVAASLIPGLGGMAPAVPVPVIAVGLAIVLLVSVLLDAPLRGVVARLIPRGRVLAEEVAAFVLLWTLLRPLLATALGALVAAAIAVGLYKVVEPLLDRFAERRRDASDE